MAVMVAARAELGFGDGVFTEKAEELANEAQPQTIEPRITRMGTDSDFNFFIRVDPCNPWSKSVFGKLDLFTMSFAVQGI
jgi:hypothetical protein